MVIILLTYSNDRFFATAISMISCGAVMITIIKSLVLLYLFLLSSLLSVQNNFVVKSQHVLRHLRPIRSQRFIQKFERQRNSLVKVSAKPVSQRSVVDIALKNIYQDKLVPEGFLQFYFKDIHLSDVHDSNIAINQLVANKLDCTIGYAFAYVLTLIARMSPYRKNITNDDIPVITTVSLTSNLDNRHEYKLLTRLISPYKVLTKAILMVFDRMNWLRVAYVFYEQRYGSGNVNISYGECYLQMVSLQM